MTPWAGTAGDGYPPAPIPGHRRGFTAAVRQAVGDATVNATLGDCAVRLGFGEQIDNPPLRHGVEDQATDYTGLDGGVR